MKTQNPPGGGTTFSALTYSYTGTLTTPPIFTLSTPAPFQNPDTNVLQDYSGKWVGNNTPTFPASNLALTSVTFTDLQGSSGSLSPVNSLPFLTSVSFPVLTAVAGTFAVSGCPLLTTLSIPNLAFVEIFSMTTLPVLTALSAPSLIAVTVGAYAPTTMVLLTTLSAASLKYVATTFAPSTMAALTALSFNSLVTVGSNFAPTTMASLTSMSFTSLTSIGVNFAPTTMASLTTMAFAAVTDIGGTIAPTTMAALTSLTFGGIQTIGTTLSSGSVISIISGTAALTTFTLGTGLKQIGNGGGNVVITSAALTQAAVDALLVRLAALDGTAGTTTFDNRTVTITGTSATPSATGLAAKATLVARGCTVTNN